MHSITIPSHVLTDNTHKHKSFVQMLSTNSWFFQGSPSCLNVFWNVMVPHTLLSLPAWLSLFWTLSTPWLHPKRKSGMLMCFPPQGTVSTNGFFKREKQACGHPAARRENLKARITWSGNAAWFNSRWKCLESRC